MNYSKKPYNRFRLFTVYRVKQEAVFIAVGAGLKSQHILSKKTGIFVCIEYDG